MSLRKIMILTWGGFVAMCGFNCLHAWAGEMPWSGAAYANVSALLFAGYMSAQCLVEKLKL